MTWGRRQDSVEREGMMEDEENREEGEELGQWTRKVSAWVKGKQFLLRDKKERMNTGENAGIHSY